MFLLIGHSVQGGPRTDDNFACENHSRASDENVADKTFLGILSKIYLEDAYKAFSDLPDTKPKERARVFLRTGLLKAKDSFEVGCQRQFLVQLGVTGEFLTFFDDVADWASNAKKLSGEDVYKLSKETGPPWPEGSVDARTLRRINRLNEGIAKLLWHIAVDKEYPQALREGADLYFDKSNNNYSPCMGASHLQKLVRQGDSDAAIELGYRYLNGRDLAQDDARAFVWFGIAASMGRKKDVDEINRTLFERLSEVDKPVAAKLIRTSSFPTCRAGNSLSETDKWKEACGKDLAKVVSLEASTFQVTYEVDGIHDTYFPRKLAALHIPCLDEIVFIAEQMDWGRMQETRGEFIKELMWMKDLLQGDMEDIFQLALFYRNRDGGNMDGLLKSTLLHWLVVKEYPPAVFDAIQQGFLTSSPPHTGIWLMSFADQGYVPAMLDAARRYLNGDALEKDLGAAYYWIKRAEAAHGDLSGIIEKPFERLLEQMTDAEKASLEYYVRAWGEIE